MANSTLLQLTQQAMQEMGVAGYGAPASVIANTNTDVVQTLALTNGYARQLLREHEWQFLNTEYRFTTVFYQYTATTTDASTTISAMSSTTGLTTNPTYFMVTGTGIEQDTYLVSVNAGASTAVLSQAASATGTVTLTFSQTMYAFPSGFDRLIDRTDWDKSRHWEMLGPETAQQWQWLKSGWISTGPRVRYRVLGDLFQIWPPLSTNDYLGFEYVTKNWVLATGATTTSKTGFTVDTDTCIFPDPLMNAMIKRAYFKAKGFSPVWDEDYASQIDIAKANDAGSPTLSLSPRPSDILISANNIPDADFG